MARSVNAASNVGYVSGNLAYDIRREERREARREEPAYRRASAPQRREAQTAARPRRRERQKIAPLTLLGFAAVAVMIVVMLTNFAQLTVLSANVVSMQNSISELEETQTRLQTRYEQAFDLAAVKAAAESAGMAKPSPSQIFYIDLSEPDSAVVYQQEDAGVLSRFFTSLGSGFGAVVEYFK